MALHTSAVARASEPKPPLDKAPTNDAAPSAKPEKDLATEFRHLPFGLDKLGEKLGASPEALSAVRELMDVLKKHGINLAVGYKPTILQLAKLATNSEVRQSTTKGTCAY